MTRQHIIPKRGVQANATAGSSSVQDSVLRTHGARRRAIVLVFLYIHRRRDQLHRVERSYQADAEAILFETTEKSALLAFF